ncbi:MAG TPA: NrsF family protein [Candidatus Acidoferrum sp.]|nr:NrsF family protein [Candidatus Acidoferrum sp.]
MRDRDVDEVLNRAAQAPHEVDRALLERVGGSIKSSMEPVRPLPPTWALASGLVLVCAAVALAGAARAGFGGAEKLSVWERALIFPALGVLAWIAAAGFIGEMIPGSRRRIAPGVLLGIGSLALIGLFAALFRDYRTEHFVSTGIVCLMTGLLHAFPTGLASWWVLRRGFAVNSIAAGLAGGTLAGLAGLAMLELHCANFEAPHVLLWHTAVVPVSAATGALLAWALRFRAGSAAGDRIPPR